jgi:integrase
MTIRLTDAVIKKLPLPAHDNRIVYDANQHGFGVRVSAGGAKSFVLNYRVRGSGRERRFTIGGFPSWSTSAARVEARRLQQEIDRGADPLGNIEKSRAAPTMADLIARFEDEHIVPRLRPATATNYRSLINRHIAPHFGKHTKVADVTFADIDALHRKIVGKYAANRTIATLSKMFELAKRWGMVERNPCESVERNPEQKRKRYLSGEELARLTVALAAHPDRQAANIIRMLLLTGARSGEVMGLRWDAVEAGIWTKPASTTKQKADHVVPLSAPAQQLLAGIERTSEFVFPGMGNTGHKRDIQKSWQTICRSAGITKPLRIHDLRHSFASQLASTGASLSLIGALLGHSSPNTTARYTHLYDDPLRKAVESVGAAIENAGKPDARNVVDIKGGRREP